MAIRDQVITTLICTNAVGKISKSDPPNMRNMGCVCGAAVVFYETNSLVPRGCSNLNVAVKVLLCKCVDISVHTYVLADRIIIPPHIHYRHRIFLPRTLLRTHDTLHPHSSTPQLPLYILQSHISQHHSQRPHTHQHNLPRHNK